MRSHLVIGGSGLLGRSLLRMLGPSAIGTYAKNRFDGGVKFDAGTDDASVFLRTLNRRPDFVYLLHGIVNPDSCAKDPAGTGAINIASMIRLIEAVWHAGGVPVYMSTDYVFDGTRGMRTEEDQTCASTEYGRQKASIEGWLQRSGNRHIIARSSKIVSSELGTHSVLGQMIGDFNAARPLKIATDQVFSPMHVDDTCKAMVGLACTGANGLYNVCGTEAISRYDLAMMMLEEARKLNPDLSVLIEPCSLAEIPFAERRPLNTSICNEKLRIELGLEFRTMREACSEVATQHYKRH